MVYPSKSNRLINSLSPYLLQHAYNPVDWFPWGKEALEKAIHENKPIIVSIGYSACHWCHVMEKECFEKEEVASIMNTYFVCIKVDREERPDIDHIYMDAIQAMGLSGGWPLHVFLTPEAKPFYGGTYFPLQQWKTILIKVAEAYKTQKQQLENSATQFVDILSIKDTEKFKLTLTEDSVSTAELHHIYDHLADHFDTEAGGIGQAPKFPMPCNYFFLLRYYYYTKNEKTLHQITHTLDQIASGGIYDQIGGGFSRYAVDDEWIVPHFEKMLYDNAQLISLYAETYTLTKENRFKDIIYETIQFLQEELMQPQGGFYSALDADSEGIEGKFYIWKKEEIDKLLGADSSLFNTYYHITQEGNWENGYNILYCDLSQRDLLSKKHNLTKEELDEKIKKYKKILLDERKKRIKPSIDDKIITSWNALTISGLVDAYTACDEPLFLKSAIQNADFLLTHLKKDRELYRIYKDGSTSVNAYLDDYACLIQALIKLYQVTFNERWILESIHLTDYVIEHFYDPEEQLFYFTSSISEQLIARKKELFDNVIPSSNSIMAINLHFLSLYTYNQRWSFISDQMLQRVRSLFKSGTTHLTNWACLYIYKLYPTIEISIIGKNTAMDIQKLNSFYLPNKLIATSPTSNESQLAILKDKNSKGEESTFYICYNKKCISPIINIEDVIAEIKKIEY